MVRADPNTSRGTPREREETYKQALHKATLTIRELLEENAALKKQTVQKEPLAVVGMACRFPGGANSPEEFWTVLRDGRDAISDVPAERWTAKTYYAADQHAPGKMYSVRGGFLNIPIDCFDASFFGIGPREARALDPQHRLLLEVSWEALEHACLDPAGLKNTKTGVFVGMSSDDYAQAHRHSGQPERIDAYSIMGTTFSTAVGRLSYTLGLQGPCMALDTACSSSLVALHLACQSLRSGEADCALVGGVNLMLSPALHIGFSKLQAISPDGTCKTFDASANGYGRGEGCGMVVLKRLPDAVQAGNRILALVRGSAINQDGKTNGLAAPNGNAQQAVIRQALKDAGLSASAVEYIEAHGTGTILGDPIEVEALGAVFGPGRQAPLRLGAVKTNIGHLEPAAGVAGLIKIILSLLHAEIPQNLHFEQPNPHIAWENLPLQVVAERSAWKRSSRPRVAGLSSFGFSGTNAHVIIEEAPAPPETPAVTRPADAYLLSVSARDENALRTLAAAYLALLSQADTTQAAQIGDVCYSASLGRRHWAERLAVVGCDRADIQKQLADYLAGRESHDIAMGTCEEGRPPAIAFLCTGQGAQYPGMGRGLYHSQAVFRQAIDRCDRLLQPFFHHSSPTSLPTSLVELLFSASAETLNQTAYTQPLLFALEYALAELWAAWGIRPSVVMGHSVGEYVAAWMAGVFSLEDGLRLVAERGRLMQSLPNGGCMAAVFASPHEVAAALRPYTGQVDIAAFNDPEHVVISGQEKAVQSVCSALEDDGIRTSTLAVSQAFHSHLMEPMLAEFERVAQQVTFSPPQIALISNITGQTIGAEVASAEYWLQHIRQPVAFAAGMHTLQERGIQVFVELGPKPTLLGMGRRCLAEGENGNGPDPGIWLPSLRQNVPDQQQIYAALAALYVTGANVKWAGVYADQACRWVSLPSYPFQRKRFWADSPEASARQTAPLRPPRLAHPLLDHTVGSPVLESIVFETRFGTAALPLLEDHLVFGKVVVSGACLTSMILGAAQHAFGEGSVHLSDIVLHQALVIPDGGERRVQLGLKPDREEPASFRVVSVAADTGAAAVAEAGILHVTGSVRVRRQADQSMVCDIPSPLETWDRFDAESASHIRGQDVYEAHRRHHIEWGPSNRWIDRLRLSGTEAIARLRLPDNGEGAAVAVDGYQLHPGLIDSCFSLVVALAGLDAEEILLPFAVEQFRLVRPATGTQFWAYSRRRVLPEFPDRLVGDIWLMDEQGELIAECLGLEGRQATAGRILQNLQKDYRQWFYQLEWRASKHQEHVPTAAQAAETWLIFMDKAGYGAELAQRLHAHGCRTIAVIPGSGFDRLGPDRYCIDPLNAADMQVLIETVFDPNRVASQRVSGLVYLWGLDTQSDDSAALEAVIARSCEPVLHCVQALSGLEQPVSARLTLVSKGAQVVGLSAPESVQLSQAPLWGLGKTIALERPELACRRIDLDPQETPENTAQNIDFLVQELLCPDREDQIALRRDARLIPRLSRYQPSAQLPLAQTFPVRADGSYLICGGFGGLGRLFARDLVSRGARYLTLCGRSPAGPDAQELISELEQLGATIQVCQADITRYAEIRAVIESTSQDRPLVGIVHAAGVLDDSVLARLDWRRFSQVLAAKTVGLWHLHELSQPLRLDFFMAFSSMVSLVGSPAQAPYVAANTFVDTLMQLRRNRGLPGLSINWGPWAEVGMTARLNGQQRSRLSRQGIKTLLPSDAFRALEHVWPEPPGQVGIMDINWPEFLLHFPGAMDSPLFASFVSQLDSTSAEEVASYVLGVPPGGNLEALTWQPYERRAPAAGEVEIRVQTAGLNFKDVLLALHVVPASGPILGLECAGEVVRAGAGVTHLCVGKAVLAMAPGSFGRYVTVPAHMVAALPDGLSFEAAATIPLAFLTAAYALEELANIQPGERVLIHAAAGGVGQAAIQLAQRAGAEIFATASEGKWDVLRALGVKHVLNSRSLEFAQEIRRLTNGEGVDVVLNSLRGEFTTQSVSLLRPGGRFLEIGITDIRSTGEVAELAPDASYHAIDLMALYQAEAEILPRLLARILGACETGELKPLAYRVFPVNEVAEAFRYMQQAKHTGKLVVSFSEPPTSLHVARPAMAQAKWLEQLEQTPIARRRAVLTSLVRAEIGLVLGAGPSEQDEQNEPLAPRQRLFDVGLDSLMAVELKNRVSSALGCTLATTVLFDYPTLEALVDHLCAVTPNIRFEIPAPTEAEPSAASPTDAEATSPADAEAFLDQLSQQELENLLAEKLSVTAEE